MSLLEQASLIVTPNAYKESKLYSVVPSDGAGDMDVVRATTATRVNSAGLIESVAVNVPRIDYTNGSCPSLLVEPQRTNLATYSDQLNQASWAVNATITTNSTISPDGTQNAETILGIGFIGKAIVQTGISTFSVFAKAGTSNEIRLNVFDGTTDRGAYYNLSNGTITSSYGTIIATNSVNYGNGWYRVSITTNNAITSYIQIHRDSAQTCFIYGAQLEAGSYPTSYIPTVASTVTRNADVISKTGISSLIGTEFTLFFDGYETIGGNSSRYLVLKGTGGTYANAVLLESNSSNQIVLTVLNSSSATVFGSFSGTLTNGQRFKLAVRCKNNDFAFYVNGALIGSQASGTVPTTSDLYLGYYTDYSDNYNKINSAVIFNSALTNTELAQLTTI